MSKVIDFKSAVESRSVKIDPDPNIIGSDEVDDFVYSMISDFAEELFAEFGLDLADYPDTLYEAFVISESMKAAVYRTLDVQHPFQVVTKDVFESMFPNENIEDFFTNHED